MAEGRGGSEGSFLYVSIEMIEQRLKEPSILFQFSLKIRPPTFGDPPTALNPEFWFPGPLVLHVIFVLILECYKLSVN